MSTKTAFVEEWLKGKTREDFALIEHCNGRLLWPVKINRLRKNGKFEEESAYLQVLDPVDVMDATQEAMRIFDERGFDKDDERVAAIWTELEMFARISVALRSVEKDSDGIYPNMHSLDMLLDVKTTGISRSEVENLNRRLDIVTKLQDPRLDDVDRATVIRVANAIAETGNLSPLVAIAGSELDTCVVGMASILIECLRHEFSSPSLENSKQGRSRSKNSPTSSTAKHTSAPAPSTNDAMAANAPTNN
jgi:hypothetical protein